MILKPFIILRKENVLFRNCLQLAINNFYIKTITNKRCPGRSPSQWTGHLKRILPNYMAIVQNRNGSKTCRAGRCSTMETLRGSVTISLNFSLPSYISLYETIANSFKCKYYIYQIRNIATNSILNYITEKIPITLIF